MSAIAPRIGGRHIRRGVRRLLGAVVRVRPRTWGIVAAVLAGLIAFGLWFRDSTFVDVRKVEITGVSGPQAGKIRTALRDAALDQTTLNVNKGALRDAVASFPLVTGIDVSAHFPHAMTIQVHENVPVAAVASDGIRTAVTADGELLHSVPDLAALPVVPIPAPPSGGRVTGAAVLQALRVLAAAPPSLATRVTHVTRSPQHGIVVQFRRGPVAYFGGDESLPAKWAALAAVLVDPSAAGASYIDLTVPEHPAAGGVTGAPRQSDTPQLSTTTTPTSTGTQP